MESTNGKPNDSNSYSSKQPDDQLLDLDFLVNMPMEDVRKELDRRNLDPHPLMALVERKKATVHFLPGSSRWLAAAAVFLMVFGASFLIQILQNEQKAKDASISSSDVMTYSFENPYILVRHEIPREEYVFEQTIQPVPNLYSVAKPLGVPYGDDKHNDTPTTLEVVAFFDPACSHSQKFYTDLKAIAASSPGAKFLFVPIASTAVSIAQVEALYTASEENKFFDEMDRLIEQDATTEQSITINGSRFEQEITRGQQMLANLGVDYLPLVVVNGEVLKTPMPRCETL